MQNVPKTQVAQAVQLQIFARDIDPEFGKDGNEDMITQFSSTFSLSTFTTFDNVRRVACAYWGVSVNEFELFSIDDRNQATNLDKETVKILSYL